MGRTNQPDAEAEAGVVGEPQHVVGRQLGLDRSDVEAIFYGNAKRLVGSILDGG